MTQFMNDCKFTESRSNIDGNVYTECIGQSGEKMFSFKGILDESQRLSIFAAIINGYQQGCNDGYARSQRDIRVALGIKG